jgi:hypothetical protein
LQAHPRVAVIDSLLQDQLLGDAEATLRRHGGGETLARLHADARKQNRAASRGRIKSDWIEPETLFWAAWRVLPAGEKAALAREAIGNFLGYVQQAAAMDPRQAKADPMEWHRHRIHPLLWQALEDEPGGTANDAVRKELQAWQTRREDYLARRPVFSQTGMPPPWEEG